MGQKVNPVALRLGVHKTWDSKWFASRRDYANTLHEDIKIREYIFKGLKDKDGKSISDADISRVEIIRYPGKVSVNIFTARPGVLIGSKGSNIEVIEKQIKQYSDKAVHISIKEIGSPDTNARVIGLNIGRQIIGRRSYKNAMKRALQRAMENGAKGIKIMCSGRLGGAEMKRTELYKDGRVPLHTLRADIDYAQVDVVTTYGVIGVKVWVYKGDIYERGLVQDSGTLLVKKSKN
jgi:small subunit ribosomal protein S3